MPKTKSGIDYEYMGDIELTDEEAADFERRIAESDTEVESRSKFKAYKVNTDGGTEDIGDYVLTAEDVAKAERMTAESESEIAKRKEDKE